VVGVTTPQLGRGRLHGLRVLIAEDAWTLADTLSVILGEEVARVLGPYDTAAEAMENP
jgi:hypothetical protein